MMIINEIKNEVYKKLIDYAFEKCDAIMFVFRRDGFNQQEILELENNLKHLKNLLSDSLLKHRNGAHWVYTKVGYKQLGIENYYDPPNFDKKFDILFFKSSKEVKDYLLCNKNLYNWLNPQYPEDISFFKNGYCWLYSVAHEEMCDIYCESNEEYEYLKSMGIEFFEKKFEPTLKKYLYYEDYGLDSIKDDSNEK